MEQTEFLSIPIIVSAVFALMSILKNIFTGEDFKKIIPLLSVTFGALFGVALFYTYPEALPTDNVVGAIILGAVSGWAATGADQTVKQLTK